MSKKNTGILEGVADALADFDELEQMKAHFAMLALRDMANHAVKHALEIAELNPAAAEYFNFLAGLLRDKERAAAKAAGITE